MQGHFFFIQGCSLSSRLGDKSAQPCAALEFLSTYLTVIQHAELLDDPLLQDKSFPQLFPVVLHGHFALLLLDRVFPIDGSGPHAAHSGRTLEENAAAGGGQRGTGFGAGGRHSEMCRSVIKEMCGWKGRTAVPSGDCVLHGRRENGEELLNSCYLKRSAGDRREGGANTARSERLSNQNIKVGDCNLTGHPAVGKIADKCVKMYH